MKSYSTNKTIFNHIHEIRSFGLTDFSDNKLSNNKGFTYIFVIKVKFSNEGKIKGQLPLERIFGFCKIF